MEIYHVGICCVQKSVIINLAVNSVLFRVIHSIIIESPASLVEYDSGSIFEVHVDSYF